jgi:hypothetical protein
MDRALLMNWNFEFMNIHKCNVFQKAANENTLKHSMDHFEASNT